MSLFPASWRPAIGRIKERILLLSLRSALREQGLEPEVRRLREAVPDIASQYSGFSVTGPYLELKVRGQHAFQVSLARLALGDRPAKVVDLGDSAGTHIAYLQKLIPQGGHRFLSINLDGAAVARIKAKGLEAVKARAEDLAAQGLSADVFLCFETLEHLSDPITFLHDLSKTGCRTLVLTVPYVAQTRMGLHHLRTGMTKTVGAESVHLFELAPEDLRLLFRHSGWRVSREKIYLQYPRFSILRLMKVLWRRVDFEGFYGVVLERDDTWSRLYEDWR